MRDLSHIVIPKIKEQLTFERLVKDITEAKEGYGQVQFNGRSGQHQDGVDVFARNESTKEWIGIQCKVRSTNVLSKTEILNEIKKAKNFNPKLTTYHIYTTASRDVNLQEYIRINFDEFYIKYGFEVHIVFWEDIENLLKIERYYAIYHRYYNEFFANNETLGHGIGKVINLELGIEESLDSHYELMIGKIPDSIESNNDKANYYRGVYFVINFLEKKMETFPIPCASSDLEQCFSNKLDRFRISNWINSIPDIDKFIYINSDSYTAYIYKDKYQKFLKDLY